MGNTSGPQAQIILNLAVVTYKLLPNGLMLLRLYTLILSGTTYTFQVVKSILPAVRHVINTLNCRPPLDKGVNYSDYTRRCKGRKHDNWKGDMVQS